MRAAIAAALAGVACAALAETQFRTDPWIGAGMVFQRGAPFEVSGDGNPGDTVTVTLGKSAAKGTVDAKGRWTAALPPFAEGGPFTLTVAASSGAKLEMSDVYAGDVWVCSGQSNMEMPVWCLDPYFRMPDGDKLAAAAHDPKLRLLKAPKATSLLPKARFAEEVAWQGATTSGAVEPFSAVGYTFGLELRRRHPDVPIGLVGTYWGGTRIEPWIPEETLAKAGYAKEVDFLVEARRADFKPKVSEADAVKYRTWLKAFEAEFEKGRKPGAWKTGDLTTLPSLPAPGVAEYRFTFEVKPEAVGHDFTFHIDAVDDADVTFLDGREIGATTPFRGHTFCWQEKRDYAFKVDRPGRHEIVLRGYSLCGPLWMYAPIRVQDRTDGTVIDLGAKPFEERILFLADLSKVGGPRPTPPELEADPRKSNSAPAVIFNAMVAPLKGMRVAGTVWFQGCSNNTEADRYAGFGRTQVSGWREFFRSPSMPFLVTQLAAWEHETAPRNRLKDDFWKETKTDDLGFAPLRAAQYEYGTEPDCGIACAIDIGDSSNIHFPNKREVGRRLAHEAFRVAYGEKGFAPGPSVRSASVRGGKVVVKVKDSGEGLAVDGDGTVSPRVFALAGKDGVVRWATARLTGPDEIEVSCDGVEEPTEVRYAYIAYPGGNLIRRKGDGLPLFPFRLSPAR